MTKIQKKSYTLLFKGKFKTQDLIISPYPYVHVFIPVAT